MSTGGEKSGSPFGVARVLADYALGRVAPRTGVRRLLAALDRPDEEGRMAAYMALVKLGPRIAPLLLEAARRGEQTVHVLHVLRDQGDPAALAGIEEFTTSADPEVVAAARESIAALGDQPSK